MNSVQQYCRLTIKEEFDCEVTSKQRNTLFSIRDIYKDTRWVHLYCAYNHCGY